MIVLPIHRSLKLLPNNTTPKPISSSAPTTTSISYKPTPLHRLIIDHTNNKPHQSTEVLEPSLRTSEKPTWQEETAVASMTQRLERAAERVIESEIKDFKEKLKGKALSEEENILVETMSREIVTKFLEEPMRYLRTRSACNDDFEERVKKLNLLVKILEESYFGKPEKKGIIFSEI